MAMGTRQNKAATLQRLADQRRPKRRFPFREEVSERKQAEIYARCAAGLGPVDEAPAMNPTAQLLFRIGMALPIIAMMMLYKAICTASLPELAGHADAVGWIFIAGVFSIVSLGCGLAAVAKGAGAWGSLAQAMGGGTLAMSFSLYFLGTMFAGAAIGG